ncbi:hypothetical protein GUJ93_ZPchr0001g31281 [Zizania palustris]|uniref:Uncharacterized protein n=1 Tax=Zizania palustris TaxID=103762 RepID=A0A8J5VLU4_ZIZPA|nr:hypothetical protein GUJ93_ZPchr0001g31281 [Zizania palustris]
MMQRPVAAPSRGGATRRQGNDRRDPRSCACAGDRAMGVGGAAAVGGEMGGGGASRLDLDSGLSGVMTVAWRDRSGWEEEKPAFRLCIPQYQVEDVNGVSRAATEVRHRRSSATVVVSRRQERYKYCCRRRDISGSGSASFATVGGRATERRRALASRPRQP